jgi:hypothetical protein
MLTLAATKRSHKQLATPEARIVVFIEGASCVQKSVIRITVLRGLRMSRRSIAIAAALFGTVSLAIGAHAALSMRALDAGKAVATEQAMVSANRASRIALVIGNGHYPDANEPLAQPIK